MKKLLTFILLAVMAGAPAVRAQVGGDGALAIQYNVDSATLTYCRAEGTNGDIFGGPRLVVPFIKTVGSSATVTEFTASTNPFAQVAVNDVLVIRTPTATDEDATTLRVVTAKASAASITVDTAINLSATGGFQFSFYHTVCGTAATSGWFAVPTTTNRVGMILTFDQGDITALSARWECKAAGAGALPQIIYPGESSDCGPGATLSVDRCSWPAAQAGTATGALTVVDEGPIFSFCRVGLAFTGADASDAAAAREKVTVRISLR